MPANLKHIVIADDDADDVELFREAVFETCPETEITSAENGVKLLALLKRIPTPDAIVLDLNMPLKGGRQCLEEIRAKEEFDDVLIAMLSTSNSFVDIETCLAKGASHYYVKPATYTGMKNIAEHIYSCLMSPVLV